MSIDQRLRNGLHPADPDHGLDTLAALHRVEQRAETQARTTRVVVGVLLAAVLVAVIGVGAALQGRPDTPDVVAGEAVLVGTYVVDVPDSPVALRDGLVGRWVISLEADGALRLRPPSSYTGATTGAAWRVEDELLRTDALVEPGCQAANGYVGRYRWSLAGDRLTFGVVEDACDIRRILFAGSDWEVVS